jgi:hypothetical protein
MSGLTKKTIQADRTLSTLLGVNEGELVSYADLSKGVHKYIKDNDLTNPKRRPTQPVTAQPAPALAPTTMLPQASQVAEAGLKKCRDCGEEIPAEAMFCDLCGVKQ